MTKKINKIKQIFCLNKNKSHSKDHNYSTVNSNDFDAQKYITKKLKKYKFKHLKKIKISAQTKPSIE